MRYALAALVIVVGAGGAEAQGQNQREAISLLIDIGAYSQACINTETYMSWKIDWKMWSRILSASGISYEDLRNPGIAQQRAELETDIARAPVIACRAYVTRYGPKGTIVPNLMFANKDEPIEAKP